MPAELTRRAAALAAGDGSWVPPIARPASTVVLLRDAPQRPMTYLMRRAPSMAFAAGMHVFPGGRIDDEDLAARIDFVGQPIDPDRMTADVDLARGIIVGAVREVFEETGVLLAVDESGRLPVEDRQWEDDRMAVNASSEQLPLILARRGLAIDPDLLPLWSHWITPEVEERRYDVRFFVTRVPEGQSVRDVSGEADRCIWVDPAQALTDYHEGRMAMLPPTVSTLADLVELPDTADLAIRARDRVVRPLLPRTRMVEGEVVWEVVDARTDEVVWSLDGPPAGSESRGIL